ncbi:hypothetical protein ScalyP_jg10736, partial [Parmales sp. scaly parma]
HVKNTPTKVQELVTYSPNLNLNGSSYTLVSVNMHEGNVGSGHCYSRTRVNGNWIEFNDQTVGNLCAEEVEANSDAYILVYEENTATTPAPTQTPTPTTEIEEDSTDLSSEFTSTNTNTNKRNRKRFHRSQQQPAWEGGGWAEGGQQEWEWE